MKGRSIIALALALLLSQVTGSIAAEGMDPAEGARDAPSLPQRGYEGGNGTMANPYRIATVVQLQNISSNLSAHYVLAGDVDATETKDWNAGKGFDPIGDASNPFGGTLDGQGYMISKLWIDRQEDRVGLFALLQGADVGRLTLDGAEVHGNNYVGVLCGLSYDSKVWNCTTAGKCVAKGYSSGGLIGEVSGSASNMTGCSADVAISPASDCRQHGGLSGANFGGLISHCRSTGQVEIVNVAGTIERIGGLVGYNTGTVMNCSSKGSLLLTGAGQTDIWMIGGLIGRNDGTVMGSFSVEKSASNKNEISVSGWDIARFIGGLIGYDYGIVTDSYSRTEINVEASSNLGYPQLFAYTGGLIGICIGGQGATNCQWAGSIEAIYSTPYGMNIDSVGGLMGYSTRSISNSRSTGFMSLNGNAGYIGGLVGNNRGSISGSVSSVSFIVTSMGDTHELGGLIGLNQDRDVTSCVATGDLMLRSSAGDSTRGYNIGGLVGMNRYRTIADSRSTGKVTVTGPPSTAYRIGGLVGHNYYGTIGQCRSASAVSVETSKVGSGYMTEIGGLVGNCQGPISNSLSEGSVEVKGTCDPRSVGGLIGASFDTVHDCTSTASVSIAITSAGSGMGAVGGLIGENSKTVIRCHSSGSLTYDLIGGSADANRVSMVGGLIGANKDGSYVYSCSHTGDLMPARKGLVYKVDNLGGLVGENRGVVDCSFFKGSISINESASPSSIGGLVGTNYKDVMNSYSLESIFYYLILTTGQNIGGLVGYNQGQLKNSYSVIVPNGVANIEIGGIAGKTTQNIMECFFDGDVFNGKAVIDGSDTGAYKNSTALMMERATFVSKEWDFTEKWGIIVHRTYPYLFPLYYAPLIEMDRPAEALEDVLFKVDYEVITSPYPDINVITEIEFHTDADWLVHSEGSRTISGTPDNLDIGTYWSNFSAEDLAGTLSYVNFTIEVINVNDPPKIVTEDITEVMEDEPYSRYYYAVDEDPLLTSLTWMMGTDAKWLFFEGNHMHGTPLNYDIGEYWVNVSVWDSEGAADFSNFTMIVGSANDAPVITTEPISLAFEDEEYRLNLTANDVDKGDRLTWTLLSAPSWLLMARTNVHGTPGNEDVGTSWLMLRVEDVEGATDELGFMLTVKNVNDAPIWTEFPADQNITEGEIVTLDALAIDQDAGDPVRYNISSAPVSNISIHATAGTIRWADTSPGNYTVTVKADDGELIASREFNITVNIRSVEPPDIDENHAPVMDPVQDREVEAGSTLMVQMIASDEDGDPLVFVLADGPDEMVVSADGKLVWTPSEDDIGDHVVNVSVTDGNATVYREFTVTVGPGSGIVDDDDDDGTSGGGMSVPLIAAVVALSLLCALLLLLLLLLLVTRRGKGGKEEGPEEDAGEEGDKEDEAEEVEEMEEVVEEGEAMDGDGAEGDAEGIVDDASDEAPTPEGPENSDA